jgi:hypothetical protein
MNRGRLHSLGDFRSGHFFACVTGLVTRQEEEMIVRLRHAQADDLSGCIDLLTSRDRVTHNHENIIGLSVGGGSGLLFHITILPGSDRQSLRPASATRRQSKWSQVRSR